MVVLLYMSECFVWSKLKIEILTRFRLPNFYIKHKQVDCIQTHIQLCKLFDSWMHSSNKTIFDLIAFFHFGNVFRMLFTFIAFINIGLKHTKHKEETFILIQSKPSATQNIFSLHVLWVVAWWYSMMQKMIRWKQKTIISTSASQGISNKEISSSRFLSLSRLKLFTVEKEWILR